MKIRKRLKMSDTTKKNVLLVDDDIDFLTQMRLMLEAQGYDVMQAESQKEAEDLLKSTTPDIAVVDLMMENEDSGFNLCYHIKKLSPDTPVILVTAVAGQTGISFGVITSEERSWIKADSLLEKPVRFEQLRREIEKLMKK